MSGFTLVSRFSKLLTPALLLATAGAAQANMYYVSTLGSNTNSGSALDSPFATIQYAINKASTGDTIFVVADTYSGNGNVQLNFEGKSLTLEALPYYGDATTVTLDCQGNGGGFNFENGETSAAVVDGFTVINGNLGGFGAGAFLNQSSPTFIDCTFASCHANGGGSIYMYSCSPTFTGVTFSKNTAVYGGAIFQDRYSIPTYTHCKFIGNSATSGGAMFLYNSDGTFNSDTFTGNSAQNGGAIYGFTNAYPVFYGGTFSGNKASVDGGAFYNTGYVGPTFFSTLITGNSAQYGGAFYNTASSGPELFNATVTANKATYAGGAIYNDDQSSAYVDWSILWNNTVGAANSEIFSTSSSNPTYVGTSDIQGGWSNIGQPNLDTDPMFVGSADFHLKSTSPLIDAGASFSQTPDDHDGNPRMCNGITDLGAYERALPTAVDDMYLIYTGGTLTEPKEHGVLVNDLANKGGTLSAVLVTKPAAGTLTLKSDGSFIYKAPTGFTGTQTFTYKAKNSKGSSSPATVTINIVPFT